MRRLILLLGLPVLLHAGWTEFRSGPFNVVTDAGDREAREVLAHLEQLRHTVGTLLGKPDATSVWPIRIVLFRNSKDAARYAGPPLALARDELVAAAVARQPLPRELNRAVTRWIIESAAEARMPDGIEQGLADLLSTIEVRATRVTIGAPLPPAERNREWARLHMMATLPDYSGKVRVLLSNLQRGLDREPAYKNAFEKTPAEMDKEVDAYLAAGNFQTAPFSGRPLDPERQFRPREVDDQEAAIRLADLLLADSSKDGQAAQACKAILNRNASCPEAHECLGLLALRAGEMATARQELQASLSEENRSARARLELALLTEDSARAKELFEAAAKLNPRWPDPYRLMAEREPNPNRKAGLLKQAASLARRDAALWRAYAESLLPLNQFAEAGRAWLAAERASVDENERAAIRQARLDIDVKRREHEEAERRRAAEEEARELQKLKDELEARVRAAEAKANEGKSMPKGEIVQWWDGPETSKLEGTLQRVDCRGAQARLTLQSAEGKVVQLLIPRMNQVVVMGGPTTLACGPQRPAKRVKLEYVPKKPIGEVTIIEFQ
ncbi:MAG: hypothetical protein IRZ15_00095 [Bryobacteraceae bacterium]|nr:hypothetical protein [Bryobacteraceae bacterium]